MFFLYLTQIRQQNLMIENIEFSLYFAGTAIGRPTKNKKGG